MRYTARFTDGDFYDLIDFEQLSNVVKFRDPRFIEEIYASSSQDPLYYRPIYKDRKWIVANMIPNERSLMRIKSFRKV